MTKSWHSFLIGQNLPACNWILYINLKIFHCLHSFIFSIQVGLSLLLLIESVFIFCFHKFLVGALFLPFILLSPDKALEKSQNALLWLSSLCLLYLHLVYAALMRFCYTSFKYISRTVSLEPMLTGYIAQVLGKNSIITLSVNLRAFQSQEKNRRQKVKK